MDRWTVGKKKLGCFRELAVSRGFIVHFCRGLIVLCDRLVLKDAFLPPHLYGQLVQKKNGFKLLQRCVSGQHFMYLLMFS